MKHKHLTAALAALCSLCAFLCMTFCVGYSCVMNRNLMHSGFLLYSWTEHFQVPPDRYSDYAAGITDYLAGKTERVQVPDGSGSPADAFHEKENRHMDDVRGLIRLLGLARVLLGALALGGAAALYLAARKKGGGPAALRGAALGAGVFLLLCAAVAALAAAGFDRFFIAFHRLFFRNDLWLLNPNTDLLVALMPTPFFIWYGGEILKRLLPVFALAAVTIPVLLWLARHPGMKEDTLT